MYLVESILIPLIYSIVLDFDAHAPQVLVMYFPLLYFLIVSNEIILCRKIRYMHVIFAFF